MIKVVWVVYWVVYFFIIYYSIFILFFKFISLFYLDIKYKRWFFVVVGKFWGFRLVLEIKIFIFCFWGRWLIFVFNFMVKIGKFLWIENWYLGIIYFVWFIDEDIFLILGYFRLFFCESEIFIIVKIMVWRKIKYLCYFFERK